jgi:CubicO group peptidase (beta-lactamase class C family)
VVLQQLLADVTGRPFAALARELVLEPAGMTHSTFEQPLPAGRDAARAHDGAGEPLAGGWHVYPELAPAGLWTTPTDLARWAVAVSAARAGRAGAAALLPPALAAEMLTAQTASARKAPDMPGDVGLGPFVGGTGRAFHFGHGGVNEGFVSDLVMYPELGTGAVLMANGDGAHLLLRELKLALAAEYGWPDVAARRVRVVALSPARAAGIAGRYTLRVGPGLPAEVRQEGGRLLLRAPQLPPDEELLPESDARFVTSTLGWRVAFTRDASGRATRMTVLREGGREVVGERAR